MGGGSCLPGQGHPAPPPPGCCHRHGDIRRGGAFCPNPGWGLGVSQASQPPGLFSGEATCMPAPLQVSPGVQSLVSTPATRWLPCNLTIPCLGSIPFPCAHWFPPAACLLTPQSPHPQARSFPWPVTRAQLHYSPQCLSQSPKPSLATQPIPLSTVALPGASSHTRHQAFVPAIPTSGCHSRCA